LSEPAGYLNIDKPRSLTSHDVVNRIRRGLAIKKAGHAGTLDPLATGVLVICIGKATRLSEYAMASTKQYRAQIILGATTETYDAEGEIVTTSDASSVTREQVEAALNEFTGEIEQFPPMYSAVKQGGRRLYQMARAGEVIERQLRQVRIHALEISTWSPPQFTLEVTCGAGTYIRSLAHDLGQRLGVGAYLNGLIRTASGSFRLENAVALDALLAAENWQSYLLPPDTAVSHLPALHLDAVAADHIRHGRPVSINDGSSAPLARAYDPEENLIAILRADGSLWRPHKVFFSAT
jgi:tRNA pseudouridine55 synthase